jgi:hypothetical protein
MYKTKSSWRVSHQAGSDQIMILFGLWYLTALSTIFQLYRGGDQINKMLFVKIFMNDFPSYLKLCLDSMSMPAFSLIV